MRGPTWHLSERVDGQGDTLYLTKVVNVIAIESALNELGLGPDDLELGRAPKDPDTMHWDRMLRDSEIERIAEVLGDFGLSR